jgi:hypothetical protein
MMAGKWEAISIFGPKSGPRLSSIPLLTVIEVQNRL